jgi:hypothetical protein
MDPVLLPAGYLALYGAANLVALGIVALAARRPDLARWFFVTLFLSASVLNGILMRLDPQLYVDGYGSLALLAPYRRFIVGFFARHTLPIVLGIALGQLAVGLLLTRRGRWLLLGGLGGSVFLLAIAPLGAAAAFPAPLALLVALLLTVLRMEWQPTAAPRVPGTAAERQTHPASGRTVRGSGVR